MNNTVTQRTDYINGMEVTPSTLTTVVHLAGGRLVKQVCGTWDPQYYYTDHRGDIRVVYHANSTTGPAEVVQEDHLTSLGARMVDLGRTNWPGWESHQNRGDDQHYSDGWNRFGAAIICGWSEERANAYANGYSRTYGGSSGASGAMGGGSAGAGGASGGKGSGGFVPSAKHEANPEGEKDKGKSTRDGDDSSILSQVCGLISKAIVGALFTHTETPEGNSIPVAKDINAFVMVSVGKETNEAYPISWNGSIIMSAEGIFGSVGTDFTGGISSTICSVSLTSGIYSGSLTEGALSTSSGVFFFGGTYSRGDEIYLSPPSIRLGNSKAIGFTISTSAVWYSTSQSYTFPIFKF